MHQETALVLVQEGKDAKPVPKNLQELAALFKMEVVIPSWHPTQSCPFMVTTLPSPITFGLKALQPFKRGKIVIQYLGLPEVIEDKEDDCKNHYTIDAGEDESGKRLRINPEKIGGLARLIPHAFFTSPHPEAITANLLQTCPQPGIVLLMATKDIQPGDHLAFNYSFVDQTGSAWWAKREKEGFSPLAFSASGKILGPALPPPEKRNLFHWQELLVKHTAMGEISSADVVDFPFDVSFLRKHFPTYQWATHRNGNILALFTDRQMLDSEYDFFRKIFSADVQMTKGTVTDSSFFCIHISGMNHKEYCRLLRAKIAEIQTLPQTPSAVVSSNPYSLSNSRDNMRQPLLPKEQKSGMGCCAIL